METKIVCSSWFVVCRKNLRTTNYTLQTDDEMRRRKKWQRKDL